MIFDKLDLKYVDEASKLAHEEYEVAKNVHGALYNKDYTPDFKEMLTNMFKSGHGLVALEDDKVVGYIAYYGPINNMFGYVKGAFSPIHGNAFGGKKRQKTASMLFEKTSEALLDQEILQYGLSIYSNDLEILEAFSLNGFGYRCADGVLDLSKPLDLDENTSMVYEELSSVQAVDILPLKNDLAKHMGSSPTYFPILEESIEDFEESCKERESRFFTAKCHNKIIGYLEITKEGETFLSEEIDYRHLCGAYLLPEYRGMNVLQSLLKIATETLEAEGIQKLGVDCETLNPSAFNFWRKYFDIYTYSLVRRLDERIL